MSEQILGARLGVAYTNQDYKLGTVYKHPNGNTYIFMQADGAVTLNRLYVYDQSTWQIEDEADLAGFPADAHTQPACVSPVTLADNEYAFVFVGPGQHSCVTDATGIAGANDIVYVSATAGTVSSGATAALLAGVSADAVIAGGATGTINAVNRMTIVDAA